MVPNQLWFRLLNLGWMMVTTIAFYHVVRKLLHHHAATIISTLVFIILTTVPWLEGHIPNGELFVMGFVLVGLWLLSGTSFFEEFVSESQSFAKRHRWGVLYLGGFFLGLGVMTKVPAIFDVAGVMLIGWFSLTNRLGLLFKQPKAWWALTQNIVSQLCIIGLGVSTPAILSVVYFVAIGSGQDYLHFGLLYNFRYAGSWQPSFNSSFIAALFTLPGKVLIATVVILFLTARRTWFSPVTQLAAGWFALALVASLLSNRPYPHYFQQIVPPLALLVGILVRLLVEKKRTELEKVRTAAFTVLFGFLLFLGTASLVLLDFAPYSTEWYYGQFYRLITRQITPEEYRNSFNHLMEDNYRAAEIIRHSGSKQMFIWGTNPMLYALSDTRPTGKYTVSFHIKDFDAYEETMQSIRDNEPLFIVTMNNETTPLPGLNEYLDDRYLLNADFKHYRLWKRISTDPNTLHSSTL